MKAALEITTCIWFIIVILMPSAATRDAVVVEEDAIVTEPQPLLLGYKTVPYTVGDDPSGSSRYSNFLTELRKEFGDRLAPKACGLPVTRETLPPGEEYVLVELKISDTQKVTLALQVNNLYLVAFRVKNSAKFFKEEKGKTDIANAKKKVFTDAEKGDLSYTGNYKDIETKGGSRENLELGFDKLKYKIEALNNDKKPISVNEEAKFVLTVIQMVCEAVRYKYIEEKVVTSTSPFKPDSKMLKLETSWQKNSKKVRQAQANNKCDTVKDITMDTALLLGTGTAPSKAFHDYLWFKIAANLPNIPLVHDAVF